MIRGSTRRAAGRSAGVAAGTALAAVAGGASTASAHHSYPATYDTDGRVTVSGVVQLVRFTNPHVHIVLEGPADALAAGPLTADGATESAATLPIFQEAGEEVPPPASEGAESEEPSPLTLWVLDLPGPGRARQLGLTPEALPPGTPLTVLAWPARAPGSHDLAPLTITFDANGRSVRIR